MLGLLEILQAKNISLGSYKVHLATKSKTAPPPLEAFFDGTFKHWQETQNAKNFQCDNILSLINLDNDMWLFAGVYKVLGVEKGIAEPFLYRTELLPGQDDLIARVIVRYQRSFRNSYIWGHKYGKLLEVAEIRPQPMSIREFPGYNKVIVSHRELRLIVAQQEPSWKSALKNVKGIYLISDISNGKHYVGCVYEGGNIWQRWEKYASNGHGENVELQTLMVAEGISYAENFQYSILEIEDLNATEEYIKEREKYWKKALLSRRPYGYNAN
jgi:hypothetical protein